MSTWGSRGTTSTLDSVPLPPSTAQDLDAVRKVGNFAAHPIKYEHTGVMVDVEPGEAEWNLDTLEKLFDYVFVKPARSALCTAGLNEKLKAAGKPLLKTDDEGDGS